MDLDGRTYLILMNNLRVSKLKSEYKKQFYASGVMNNVCITNNTINMTLVIDEMKDIIFAIDHNDKTIYFDYNKCWKKIIAPLEPKNLSAIERVEMIEYIEFVINSDFKLNDYEAEFDDLSVFE